jgi:hypothetical protein
MENHELPDMNDLSSAFEAACARFDGHNFEALDKVDQVLPQNRGS